MKKIGFVVLLVSLILSTPAFAQQRTISGVILSSENQEPLIGATVSVKGNEAHGVVTDIDGKYTLEVGPDDRILVIAYLGMKTQFIKVPHKSQLNIVLEPESLNLDEVVVTGYGNFTKSSFTGSANTLKGDMMKNIPVVSVEQKLQGTHHRCQHYQQFRTARSQPEYPYPRYGIFQCLTGAIVCHRRRTGQFGKPGFGKQHGRCLHEQLEDQHHEYPQPF